MVFVVGIAGTVGVDVAGAGVVCTVVGAGAGAGAGVVTAGVAVVGVAVVVAFLFAEELFFLAGLLLAVVVVCVAAAGVVVARAAGVVDVALEPLELPHPAPARAATATARGNKRLVDRAPVMAFGLAPTLQAGTTAERHTRAARPLTPRAMRLWPAVGSDRVGAPMHAPALLTGARPPLPPTHRRRTAIAST